MYEVIKDIVILPEDQGRFVVMNVFSRSCLGVESDALMVLSAVSNMSIEKMASHFGNKEFKVWDIEWFSNDDGLLGDPTRYIRSVSNWPEPFILDITGLLGQFAKHFLLIDDINEYRNRFKPKKSILDFENLGNFHEQVGQHLMIHRRVDPVKWWVQQKFAEDGIGLCNNLYKAVQEYNLARYFISRFTSQDLVIDIGCGTGYYANMIAETGARVLGIDPNPQYIEMARNRAGEGTQFEVANISEPGALDHIPSESADYVFMSDALLFYFVPVSKNQTADLTMLFKDLHRILKPEGRFISVEPHYVFWLLPWLGEADRPYTVLTEYWKHSFRVTPGLSELIQAFSKGGFAVSWMEELLPNPDFEAIDQRAYYFAKEYPLWQLYELKPQQK